MDFGGFLAGLIVIILIGIGFLRKKKSEEIDNLTNRRTVTKINGSRLRRRRIAGGFYPIGYTGSYLEGEDLVDEVVWMTELAAMSDASRYALGEYGVEDYYQIEDLNESDGSYDELEVPLEGAPKQEYQSVPPEETTEEEPIVEPPSDVQPVEDTPEEEKPTEDVSVKEKPESTDEIVNEEDILNDSVADMFDDGNDYLNTSDNDRLN